MDNSTPQGKQFYTPEEDAIIQQYYPIYTGKQMQQQFLPHRSAGSIQARAIYLGVKKQSIAFEQEVVGQPWIKRFFTPEEDAIIREHYPVRSGKEIQQLFMPYRSIGSIQGRGINLGIKKVYTPPIEEVLEQEPIIEVPNHKKCTKCDKTKTKQCFRRDRTRPDGLHPYCKQCSSVRGLGIKREHGKEREELAEGHKRCTICKEVKPLQQFYQNKKAKDRRWPRCIVCDNARKPVYEARYLQHLKITYGLTASDYFKMLEEHNGVCACCGLPETTTENGKVRRLAVDHCHTTGAVRGLLCRVCNQVLGLIGEDPERVRCLLKYIEERCLW